MNSFTDIVGQEKAVNTLIKNLETDHLSHAYLFIGPSGVGKRTMAQIFARQIILQSDAGAAVYYKDNVHPDLMVIKRNENKTMVSKEQITKELESWLAIKPYRAAHKVAVIEDSNFLSTEAENALLKTLEDPPLYAVIIMVSDENVLLETIISRCQLIHFRPLKPEIIKQLLVNKGVDQDQAKKISAVCQGSMELAWEYADEGMEKLCEKALQIVRGLSGSRYSAIFSASEKVEKDPLLLLNLIQAYLRDFYIYKKTNQKELVLLKENLQYSEEVKLPDEQKLIQVWQELNEYKKYYRISINKPLLTVNICFDLWQALH